MEAVAHAVYEQERAKDDERIKKLMYEAYKQAIDDFLHALTYDIESVTRIGFDGCRDIFEDKKAQKYISDHVMQEIKKRLDGKTFRN